MVHTVHDSETDAIVHHVLRAVAAADGVDPMTLPALGETLDTEALNALLATRNGSSLSVSFDYAGHQVEIRSDDSIVVDGTPQ